MCSPWRFLWRERKPSLSRRRRQLLVFDNKTQRSRQRDEAPGLRVGGNAWKWPPVWPYEQEFFTPKEDIPKPDAAAQLGGMASLMGGGMPQITSVEEKEDSVDKLNPLKFWSEEKGDVTTELDEEAAEKLRE